MALRTGHGNGAGVPRVEVLPPDELPDGVPAPIPASAAEQRRADGRFLPGNATAAEGGKAKKGKVALAIRLGLTEIEPSAAFAPYRSAAVMFRRRQCGELARTVGGGICGPAPSSIVATAALQLAASRYLFDRAGVTSDPDLFAQASKLANDSRQNLLAAHELCAREAKSRAGREDASAPWLGGAGGEPS